jgi:hypothetical protein
MRTSGGRLCASSLQSSASIATHSRRSQAGPWAATNTTSDLPHCHAARGCRTPLPPPAKLGGNLRHSEYCHGGVSLSSSQLSVMAQPIVPGDASQGSETLSQWSPSVSGDSPGDPPVDHLTSKRGWPPRSYAEVVRKGVASSQGSAAARLVKLDPPLAIHRRRKVVKPRGAWAETQLLMERRRAFYLSKMKGYCFNCLAGNHKIATCGKPTLHNQVLVLPSLRSYFYMVPFSQNLQI